SNQSIISEIKLKIPYNQKVERELRREIFVYDQDNSNKINTPYIQIRQSLCIPNIVSDNTFDVQIPDFSLETILTGSNKVTAQNILCNRYKKKTGLDPWINSETSEFSQIEKTDNYFSQDRVIKISKFPEEKDIIIEIVQKRFPFLSYTNSNAWYRDVFKYTDSEAKCPICKEVHTRYCIWGDWNCLGKDDHYYLNCSFRIDQKKVIIAIQSLPEIQVSVPNKTCLYQLEASLRQYAIEHGMDPEKFSVITEAEKKMTI
ncbi:9750_t:CDS:2, partial [Diversispora eburnea]